MKKWFARCIVLFSIIVACIPPLDWVSAMMVMNAALFIGDAM
jgi:hypothetical protein